MSLFLPNFAKIIEQTSKTGRNMKANLILLTVLATMLPALAMAQNTMRITYKDGTIQNVDITRVDSIIFVDMEPKPQDASITGDWMWGGLREGYYEVISFATVRTFTAEDCYFAYGYTNHTYGTYTYSGIQLNLFSNGIGYKRMNRWFVTYLSDNELEVMTQMGAFTYYRLQPETIRLKAWKDRLACEEGEVWSFADLTTAGIEDGQLVGLQPGTTYVQKLNTADNTTKAYKVEVVE